MKEEKSMPDCYKCKHRRSIPGDSQSACANKKAEVTGNPTGIKRGWFCHPFNFDPAWLISCSGYKSKKIKKEEVK